MIEEAKKPAVYNGPQMEIILRDPKTSINEYPKIYSLITNNNTDKKSLVNIYLNRLVISQTRMQLEH